MPKGTTTCNNIVNLYYRAEAIANIADNAAASPLASVTMALATASGAPGDTMATSVTAYTNLLPARSTFDCTLPTPATLVRATPTKSATRAMHLLPLRGLLLASPCRGLPYRTPPQFSSVTCPVRPDLPVRAEQGPPYAARMQSFFDGKLPEPTRIEKPSTPVTK